ncbi:uncharacterized protein STEHIDRAFT_136103 [Stereum hirsutum FP-91666 SS1]|uniref:uncharacterized protein n=1 Tax=Stereum hirsutum (strain FP-91666) TaxID=721885 RepID=UPI000440D417|nr:uncharacterized protein STEHIDRAFT_136103 [Stereum hirsutum FP-91666 SS1]EIM92074.1 hypothetical protein STEHIDRAFT_136103 [Stereum hirsutum FP-91666 SS1]
MTEHGKRSPIGTRREKLLQGLMAKIESRSFSHAGVFKKSASGSGGAGGHGGVDAFDPLFNPGLQKLASALSRSNLPPPNLDLMFRSLEAIPKANRSLLAIDELEPPYTAYCERLCSGFGTWDSVPLTLQDHGRSRTLPPPIETEDEVVIGGSCRGSHNGHGVTLPPPPRPDLAHGSDSSSARGSNSSIPVRSSADTGNTSLHARSEHGVLSIPISDLERRLSTDRCLDIFIMKPKQVKLQIRLRSLEREK